MCEICQRDICICNEEFPDVFFCELCNEAICNGEDYVTSGNDFAHWECLCSNGEKGILDFFGGEIKQMVY